MTKYYFILLLSSFVNAQVVNIPDDNFKNALLNNFPEIDTNNDNQIQVSEAAVVTQLYVRSLNITDYTGIEAFTELALFDCMYNPATTLDVTALTNLTDLYCSSNALTSITYNELPNLKKLLCDGNQLTTINLAGLTVIEELNVTANPLGTLDLSGMTHLLSFSAENCQLTSINLGGLQTLRGVGVSGNQLTSLNLDGLSHLEGLSCGNNNLGTLNVNQLTTLHSLECRNAGLSTLDVSNLTALDWLACSDNQLTALDITHAPEIYYIECMDNLLTTIDLSNATKLKTSFFDGNLFTEIDLSHATVFNEIHEVTFRRCPNLEYVNLKNGQKDFVYFENLNAPNLRFICSDEIDRADLLTFMATNNVSGVELNTYCSFVPGGTYNTITGTLSFDFDNNGCDASDIKAKNFRVNNGTTGATFTDALGNYTFLTLNGSFVISPNLSDPYFTIAPASATVNFASVNSSESVRDFCISPNGIHHDMEIALIPVQGARPGFDSTYRIVYKNNGNQVESGTINLLFDDAVLDFVSANPAASSQTVNNLNWTYDNLLPFESREIALTMNLNSPTEMPPLNAGDVLNYTATIIGIASHETIEDEVFELQQIVVNSLDPNDKTCLEGSSITLEEVGKYLHYNIRFQNSGSAPAEFVVVKDIIDTAKFDLASLQLTGSSHPHLTKITGNKVEFIFQDINLPAEQDDEPASHGFVAFKIKTKSNLVPGNSVSNTANIYFDYNFPITTNTALTTVALLAKDHFEDKTVSVYPNPTRNKVTITAKDNITSIQLFDLQGRLVQTTTENKASVNFNLGSNASGVYFVKVHTDKGIKVEKIIKK